ncbi:MAG: uracil-DNA glycosylase family protein [Proteobacteria bacterium]|nr:uracil-DNA glycosylase family protein [Pseudomonadota bacterium]MBS0572579.1 uracil-DNA glycosylase family protein [Pseudomonadota bacterium]
MTTLSRLRADILACRLCADRFAATATAHQPRPVAWFGRDARILIAGQAPGLRVHESGRPFDDASGQRLRDWLGIDEATFWDSGAIAFLPMALCFPGYGAKGGDLPPPPICAATWRAPVIDALGPVRLTLLIGGHAQRWHLGPALTAGGVDATLARWRDLPEGTIPLPHPSWRNTAWLKRNPWFAAELLPVLRERVQKALAND